MLQWYIYKGVVLHYCMKSQVQSEQEKYEAKEKKRIAEREKFISNMKEDVENKKQTVLKWKH